MTDRRRLMDIEWVLDNEEPSEADLREFEREIEAYITQPDDPGKWPQVAEELLRRVQAMLRGMKSVPVGAHAIYR